MIQPDGTADDLGGEPMTIVGIGRLHAPVSPASWQPARPGYRDNAPALAQCIGFTGNGLPLSMQIVGTPLDDATVLRVAHAYEGATPWRARRPMLDPNTTVANTLPPVSAPA